MGHAADPSHPRYKSLLARGLLEEAANRGMLAGSALIAHGRGEAFDYLLGEETSNSAMKATIEIAKRLKSAEKAVISLNGNTAALAGDDLLRCAAVLGCAIEINIFYRTPERMKALLKYIDERKKYIHSQQPPKEWNGGVDEWHTAVMEVPILGAEPDGLIPGLKGPRAKCHKDGILTCDTILVPLEDGDRCEALVAMGKQVLVVDLNPMSRSAKMASVTIVDELCRFANNLLQLLIELDDFSIDSNWDNEQILQDALDVMATNMKNVTK
jgi:4-phosphopantoate--beta-alanine ligase